MSDDVVSREADILDVADEGPGHVRAFVQFTVRHRTGSVRTWTQTLHLDFRTQRIREEDGPLDAEQEATHLALVIGLAEMLAGKLGYDYSEIPQSEN
jgi:hypothetical protein